LGIIPVSFLEQTMGLFDSALGAVSNQLQSQVASGNLTQVLGKLLANNGELGGLPGMMDKFNQAGLGNVLNSWIGTGSNLPISGDQLASTLGPDTLDKLAGQVGLDGSQLSDQLAQMLPGLVDKLTPHGTAPEGGLGNTGDLMGMLGGLLGKAS
jgi:uncharacterized protein YidB (DUF937 family)